MRPAANLVVARRLGRHGRHPIPEEMRYVRSFNWLGFRFRPFQQIESELLRFLEVVAVRQPRTVVEIGSARGETAFLLARAAAPDAHIVCVDLPYFPGGFVIPSRRWMWPRFAVDDQTVTLVERNSHDQQTAHLVAELAAPIDLLFIDGDHSYDGVKRDFELYTPLVADGGLVAFHDIVAGLPEVGGVPDFWRAVRGHDYEEIVASPEQAGYGIGLLRWSAARG